METSHPGELDNMSPANLHFTEVKLRCPAFSIILFYGAAIHKGGGALPSSSGYQLRFFKYCDPHDRYSMDKSPRDSTYVDGVDPVMRTFNKFLIHSTDERKSSV